MSDERQFAQPLHVASMAVAVLAAECLVIQGFLMPAAPWWAPLGAHVAIVSALCIWGRYSPGMRADVRIPMLLIVGTAALGPVGAAGTLITMLLARLFMRNAKPFEEWYQALFPESTDGAGSELLNEAALADLDNPAAFVPFAEVLEFGSFQQKQAMITLINRSFRPAFGSILKRALTDPNNAIRVQAATAMNRIEATLHARTLELTRRVNENPEDADALAALARHYDAHVYSSILDPRREEETRGRALDAYRAYLAVRPGDRVAQIALSRLLLRGGQYEEAAGSLEKAIADGSAAEQAELWYMESLYMLGRFAELRAYARPRRERLASAAGLSPVAVEAVQLWAA